MHYYAYPSEDPAPDAHGQRPRRLRLALGDDGAVVEHDEAVDQANHRRCIVCSMMAIVDAAAGKLLDHGNDLVRLAVAEARQRLVEQQDTAAGPASARASSIEPQFLGREFAGDPVGDL